MMTILARNEVDIIDAQIAYHLNAGVDFVIATDNLSDDGTAEILEGYERAGYLHLLREDGDDMRQAEWVTRMARLAATEFGADWVINSDADEFWWPRSGSLKHVLELVPERFGVVRGCWRHFVPRPDGDRPFAERMIVRLSTPALPGDKRTVHHAHQKVAHRGDPRVTVHAGNHDVTSERLKPLRTWHPFEVLHFSVRSKEQIARKAGGGWVRNSDEALVEHQLRLETARTDDMISAFVDRHRVDDAQLRRGLETGTFAIDTRLRDALRSLRQPDGGFRIPVGGEVCRSSRRPLRSPPHSRQKCRSWCQPMQSCVRKSASLRSRHAFVRETIAAHPQEFVAAPLD